MIESKKAHTLDGIIPEVKLRWSPRGFGKKIPDDETLLRILEAARWAPSSRNEQPWRFIVARKTDPHYEMVFNALDEFNQQWAWTAPVLMVVLGKKRHDYKQRSNIYHLHDVGLAMGNLLAQATAEGLSAHQMAGISKEAILQSFGLDEEDLTVISITALGYQDETRLTELAEKYQESEYKARERRNLNELVFGSIVDGRPDWIKLS